MDGKDGRDGGAQKAPTYAKAYGVACKRLKNQGKSLYSLATASELKPGHQSALAIFSQMLILIFQYPDIEWSHEQIIGQNPDQPG